MKKLFTLLTLLVTIVMGASAQTTYDFDMQGITSGDLTITNGTYDSHKITASASSTMTVQVKSYPITFTYNNSGSSSTKDVFTNIDNEKAYLQANVKNSTITITGLTVGDIIAVDYASKNNNAENIAGTLTGCQADVNNVASPNQSTRTINKFIATATTASIKETNNGYLLYNITIYHSVALTPSTAITTFCDGTNKISFKASATSTAGAEALKGFVVSDLTASSATVTEVENIPESKGVLLTGTADATYRLAIVSSAATPAANKLSAATSAYTVENDGDAYILYDGEFHPANAGNIPAGKAYILASEIPSGAGAALPLNFGEVTAVQNVEAAPEAEKAEVKKAFVNGQFVILTENGFVNALGQSVK